MFSMLLLQLLLSFIVVVDVVINAVSYHDVAAVPTSMMMLMFAPTFRNLTMRHANVCAVQILLHINVRV